MIPEKLLFDEAHKKVSITRSHFSAHSDSVNLLVIVIRERKAVKRENEFEANKRFGARLFVSALVKKIFECQEPFVVVVTVYNEVMSIVKMSLFWPGKLKSRNVLSA